MRLSSGQHSFTLKIVVAILLVVAFDQLFPDSLVPVGGSSVGAFALACLAGVLVTRPAARNRQRSSVIVLCAALVLIVALTFDPGLLAWTMFWSALSMAALLPRTIGFDDAWRWTIRLALHALSGLMALFTDLNRLISRRPHKRGLSVRSVAALLAMPLVGTGLFIFLFASANPLIENYLGAIRLPSVFQIAKWVFIMLCVWPALRPQALVTRMSARFPEPAIGLPGSSLPSVLIAITLFNLVFAIQNGLDIAFLWSGAALPAGMTMTEYVHRGAYPLIFTALLAGFFVLTMLRPGTASAASKPARRLVALWVAQNLLLVASSALRTIDYIDVYMLTAWRIAALAWMALVAVGLVLIVWRMQQGRSARWLINANALAATIVLLPCCFVDLDATAAAWNVRHAREVGGAGQPLDTCYLSGLGDAALLPIIEMTRRPIPGELRHRLDYLRERQLGDLAGRQDDWHSWTPHGALRLHRARQMLGGSSSPPADGARDWCGNRVERIAMPPLTGTPAR